MKTKHRKKTLLAAACALTLATSTLTLAGGTHIDSPASNEINPSFDILKARVVTDGSHLVFHQEARGTAGKSVPKKVGQLGGSEIYTYVWPTTLDSSTVGFEADKGILALALTIHPDFDDTPLYDEDNDGDKNNDGDQWHSHWVVLTQDDSCGQGGLKIRDIPEGSSPKMPATWPELPIYIDSPGYDWALHNGEALIRVPLKEVGLSKDFKFDAVTSVLKINENVHAPLACISNVWDIASGDLSLPGTVQ